MIARRTSSVMMEYFHQKAGVRGKPFSGTIELTPMCNMQCNMCYVRQSGEEFHKAGKKLRSVEEWISLAEQMKEQEILLLLLTGGEPLTYPGFRELYTELIKMGFVISINTNGTLIDEDTAEWFAKNPPHRFNVTLYGAEDSTYERLCHYPEGYTKATRAIELLQDHGMNVKLNCSVTPDNVCDLEKIVDYSKERKLVLQAVSYMFPPLRRDAESIGVNKRFSPEECARIEAKIRLLQYGADDLRTYCENVEQFHILEDDQCVECEGDHIRCRAGKSSFWINWDGRMVICGMMDQPYFNPFEDGFEKAWDGLRQATSAVRLPAECSICEAKDSCRTCAAMIYTETGSYDKKPQYRCDLFKAIPDACRQVLKENS